MFCLQLRFILPTTMRLSDTHLCLASSPQWEHPRLKHGVVFRPLCQSESCYVFLDCLAFSNTVVIDKGQKQNVNTEWRKTRTTILLRIDFISRVYLHVQAIWLRFPVALNVFTHCTQLLYCNNAQGDTHGQTEKKNKKKQGKQSWAKTNKHTCKHLTGM